MAEKKNELDIGAKTFLSSILVILLLMILTYILTLVIPGGHYERILSEGSSVIDVEKGFVFEDGGLPFWKWLLSPILVLGAEGSGTIVAVLAFLLIIGGVFNTLTRCHLIEYMLDCITTRFSSSRYQLLAVLSFFFMSLGAFIGSFEEVVPMVPLVVAIAISFGWDALTGIGMSLLAAGCGFASGVANPFTVGVAQRLAGLPMFSGIWFRLLSFFLIYAFLFSFLYWYAKHIEKPCGRKESVMERQTKMDKALLCFGVIIGVGILLVLSSAFFPVLQDYTMIIVTLMFLVGGTVASFATGISGKEFGESFLQGLVSMLPAVLLILMASSIKYTMTEGHILDTILYYAVGIASRLPKVFVILFLYLLVLVMNFFVASGSAKAFLLIPLIVPIAQIFGISPQLCIVAFAYGDGFSNVFYPTNTALLISLGLAHVGYGEYARWAWKFQALNLILTSLILILGLAIGY